jgi:ubiquinone/menaquinone biosynthesis C-methylase UbiE
MNRLHKSSERVREKFKYFLNNNSYRYGEYKFTKKFIKDKDSVLDAGCGTGTF